MASDSVVAVEVVSRYGGLAWQGRAQRVAVPLVDGELGVLPGRAPLLAILGRGAVRVVVEDGTETSIEVKGGFCSIDGDVVTVAADCVGDEIDRQDSRHEAELQIAALRATDDEDLD